MAQIETTTVQEIRLGLALKDLIDAWEGDEDLDPGSTRRWPTSPA